MKFGADLSWGVFHFEAHFNEHGRFTFNTDAAFNADQATWPFSFAMQKPGTAGTARHRSPASCRTTGGSDRAAAEPRPALRRQHEPADNEFYESLLGDPNSPASTGSSARDAGTYSALQPRVGATWDMRGNGTLVGASAGAVRDAQPALVLGAHDIVGNSVLITEPQRCSSFPTSTPCSSGRTSSRLRVGRRLGTLIPARFPAAAAEDHGRFRRGRSTARPRSKPTACTRSGGTAGMTT